VKVKIGKKSGFAFGIMAVIFFFFGGNFLGRKAQGKKDQMEIQKLTIEKVKAIRETLDAPQP